MSKLSLLMAAVAVTLLAAALPAEAGRVRQTTVTGPQGKTATHAVTRDHGDVQSSTTGPNGKTSSRSVDRSATGTTATVTGPNGKTATRTTSRSASSVQP